MQLVQHYMQHRQAGDFHKLNYGLNLPKMSNVLTAEFHIVNTIQYVYILQCKTTFKTQVLTLVRNKIQILFQNFESSTKGNMGKFLQQL